MKKIAEIYAALISKSRISLENVPQTLKDDVRRILTDESEVPSDDE